MKFVYDDGGRSAAGYRGDADDCVVRSSARGGVYKVTCRKLLEGLGWIWTPTMGIGTGCRVHLADGELPDGRLLVSVSKHLTCVVDGVIYDTHDPQREPVIVEGEQIQGGRCVYGYWMAPLSGAEPKRSVGIL